MTPHAPECPREEEAVLLALHALEPEQEAAVARHVRSCDVCRATVRNVEETFAEVGESAAAAPPPQLRSRILAAAQRSAPPTAPTSVASRRVRQVRSRPPTARRGAPRWVVAAAASLVIAGLAGGGIAIAQLDSQRNAATVHAGTPDDLLRAIAAAPHAVLVDHDRHPSAAIALDGTPRFYALDVPPPPAGRTWVLWGAQGPTATALAPVPAGRDGATVAVPVGRLGEYEAYFLTQEPAGALPAHHGDVLASGPVVAGAGS